MDMVRYLQMYLNGYHNYMSQAGSCEYTGMMRGAGDHNISMGVHTLLPWQRYHYL